jgi:hypothetical protein
MVNRQLSLIEIESIIRLVTGKRVFVMEVTKYGDCEEYRPMRDSLKAGYYA